MRSRARPIFTRKRRQRRARLVAALSGVVLSLAAVWALGTGGLSTLSAMATPAGQTTLASAGPAEQTAREVLGLFDKLAQMGREFDDAVLGYYSDGAVIHMTGLDDVGNALMVNMSLSDLIPLYHKGKPIAQQVGDISTYSNVRARIHGERVIVRATRYSHWKQYFSPYAVAFQKNADGDWKIVEEWVEVRR
jgi:ketosteroid isomerase-like protein